MLQTYRPRYFAIIVAILAIGCDCRLASASISISSTNLAALATDFSTGFGATSGSYSGTTIPASDTLSAIRSNSHSINQIEWSLNSGQTILSIDLDHQRSASGGRALLNLDLIDGGVVFSVDADTTYSLSGLYAMSGPASSIRQKASLFDQTTNQTLFSNDQFSFQTPNETFTLGQLGGDNFNQRAGSLNGALLMGHVYSWNFAAGLPEARDGVVVTATGDFTLKIGEPSVPGTVPEASCFVIWSLLGLTVAAWSSRRRGAQGATASISS